MNTRKNYVKFYIKFGKGFLNIATKDIYKETHYLLAVGDIVEMRNISIVLHQSRKWKPRAFL